MSHKIKPSTLEGKTSCQLSLESLLLENNLFQALPPGGTMNIPAASNMVWSGQPMMPNPILIPRQNTMVSIDNEIPAVLIEKKRGGGTFPIEPENSSNYYLPQQAAMTTAVVPNVQTCDNCPTLVHLMFNYLVEMSGGIHEPIKMGTSGNDVIFHLSVALGYSSNEIQQMIEATEKPYRCRICTDGKFFLKTELQEHIMVVHTENKNIFCAECDKCFKSKPSLQAHIRRLHRPKLVKEFRCMVAGCNKEYATSKTFQRHVESMHPDVKLPLPVKLIPNMSGKLLQPVPEEKEMAPGRGRGKARGGVLEKQA